MSAPATTTRDAPAPRSRRARSQRAPSSSPTLILLVILTCQLMVVLDATIVNVALPDIQTALHFSPAGLSWVLNAYTLTFGGLLLLGARAGDLLGRRRTFLAGIAIFTLASLVGGFATVRRLPARRPRGAGRRRRARRAVGARPAHDDVRRGPRAHSRARPLHRRLHRRQRRRPDRRRHAHRVGRRGAGCCSSTCRSGSPSLVVGRGVLPETPRHQGRFDLAGALTSTLGMASLVYGFVRAATDGWGDPCHDRARSSAGVVLLVAFVLTELHAPRPRSRRCACSPTATAAAPTSPGCCWSPA